MRLLAQPFGGELTERDDNALVFSWTGASSQPTDRAAMCALALRDSFAWARMALATASGESVGQLASGSIAGRAAALVDHSVTAIRIDPVTASILAGRFELGSDDSGPMLVGKSVAPTLPPGDDEHAPIQIDKTVGNYRIERKLGGGGMGVVYLAEHVTLGRKAVVKFVHPEYSRNSEFVQRFFTEAKTAATIRHPGIVDVFDYGQDSHGNSYIVMELLEGESMRDMLARERTLRIEIAVALGIQIASALAAAHARGVVHRDLKPDNVFMVTAPDMPNGIRAKVLDFGLAKVTNVQGGMGVTRTGAILGTPLYMSPEQCRTAVAVDHRTDVYSLGCMVFEMIAGRPPFIDNTVGDLIAAHIAKPAPALRGFHPEIPQALEDLVAKALAKDPAERQQSMEALATELATITEHVRAATPPRTAERAAVMPSTIHGNVKSPVLVTPPPERSKPSVMLSPSIETIAATPASKRATEPAVEPAPRSAARRMTWIAAVLVVLAGAAVVWQLSRRGDEGGLPSRDRRVAIVADNAGAATDAWLGPIVSRLAMQRLINAERRFLVTPADRANVTARLRFKRADKAIEITADLGDGAPIVATGGGVMPALDLLLPQLQRRLDEDQPPLADPDHDTAMARLGTTSKDAYRAYGAAVDEYFGSVMSDVAIATKSAEAALVADPTWPHGLALLALTQGLGSKTSTATLARQLEAGPRDPVGRKVLDAARLAAAGKDAEVVLLLDDEFRKAPDDVLLGWLLVVSFDRLHRRDDWAAVVRKLHDTRPDLQFGADLVGATKTAGRTKEAEGVLERWGGTAPDSPQLFISQIADHLELGKVDAAERRAQDLLFVFGESPGRLAMLCDVQITAERTTDAREIAQRLLREGPIDRARAHKRLGDIAVLEGRFAAAYDSYAAAARDGRPFGLEGGTREALEGLRTLATILDRKPEAASHMKDLADVLGELGNASARSIASFEHALESRTGTACPDLAAAVAAIEDPGSRETARKRMLRAGAVRGCGTCKDVVAAGVGSTEDSVASLYELASCAKSEGQLDLARQTLEQIRGIRTWTTHPPPYLASPFHAIQARALLAQVFAQQRDPAAARRELTSFFARWERADRPVPAITAARELRDQVAKP
ncbi:MAG: protein kinase [Deltaproteobacteria bacterium]|nr:protein kinase [Deltaproteobacteria bacterium]